MKAPFAKFYGLLGVWLGICVFVTGCGTVRVPVQVTHPAEINMASYKQVAISRIDGTLGNAFEDDLKGRLVESGRFTLVDRARLDQIMRELNLSNNDLLAQSGKAAKLGKLLPATAIITGRTNGKYEEKMTYEDATCYRDSKDKKGYLCKTYTRTGTYLTDGSIDVIDVATAQILKSRSLGNRCENKISATEANPDIIDRNALASTCSHQNVTKFMKAISPWTEMVQAPFQKDGDLPSLEAGVNLAKIGDMQGAAGTFQAAAKSAEMNPKVSPKTIAKAYFNLGLANQYSDQYDKAMEAFKKSYTLDPSDATAKEIKNCEKLQGEKRKSDEHNKGAGKGK
jgi:tetratricopeptide (TPR) repeat protein